MSNKQQQEQSIRKSNKEKSKRQLNNEESTGQSNKEESIDQSNKAQSIENSNKNQSTGKTNKKQPKVQSNTEQPQGQSNSAEPKVQSNMEQPKGQSDNQHSSQTNNAANNSAGANASNTRHASSNPIRNRGKVCRIVEWLKRNMWWLLPVGLVVIAIIACTKFGIPIDQMQPFFDNVPMGHLVANLVHLVAHLRDMFLKSCKRFRVPDMAGVFEKGLRCYKSIIERQLSPNGEQPMSLQLGKERLALSDLNVAVNFSELHTKETLTKLMDKIVKKSQIAEDEVSTAEAILRSNYDALLIYNENTLKLHLEYGSCMSSREKEELKTQYNSLINQMHDDLESVILSFSVAGQVLKELMENLKRLLQQLSGEKKSQESDITPKSLLASLWTILGGNKEEKKLFEKNLALLDDIGTNRRRFAERTNEAVAVLIDFQKYLEQVREKTQQNKYSEVEFEHHLERIRKIAGKFDANLIEDGNVGE